jgi:hypothetical protein
MSNVQATQQNQKSAKSSTAGNGETAWVDDERSLPMYRAGDCDGATIEGYLGDAIVLGPDGLDEDGKSRKFGAYVVKLTAPCPCFVQDEKVSIPAGKEIFVPMSADLRDLVNAALSRDDVFRYRLTPGKKLKLKGGYSMITWKRQRDPVTRKRAEIFPNRPATLLMTPSAHVKMLTEGSGINAEFDTATLEG